MELGLAPADSSMKWARAPGRGPAKEPVPHPHLRRSVPVPDPAPLAPFTPDYFFAPFAIMPGPTFTETPVLILGETVIGLIAGFTCAWMG